MSRRLAFVAAALMELAALLGMPTVGFATEAQAPDARLPGVPSAWTLPGQPKLAATIRAFYATRDFRPLWTEGNALSRRGLALLDAIERVDEHGLDPSQFRVPELAARDVESPGLAAELAMTRAFLNYVGRMTGGADVRSTASSGVAKRLSVAELLTGIADVPDPAGYLESLAPGTREYAALKAALAHYRRLEEQGGWPMLAPVPALKRGSRGPQVAALERRLALTGDLARARGDGLFDEVLTSAVRRFQARHGLRQSGVVDKETLAALNVPVRDRIDLLALGLERLRRLGAAPGSRYVFLNVADGTLRVIVDGETIHTARVVVGKPQQQTPEFSAPITRIEINPYWNVPRSIATSELLPLIRRNPSYLEANDYLLLTRAVDNDSAVDPWSVDWRAITPANFPFSIRQRPGSKNALGRIVFFLPNAHNVYLHDTPAKDLFARDFRFSSHGCMRVELPMRLAAILLAGQDGGAWTEERLGTLAATGERRIIQVRAPVPVHVAYLTAWAEADGTVHFRRDVYDRDPALRASLRQLARTP